MCCGICVVELCYGQLPRLTQENCCVYVLDAHNNNNNNNNNDNDNYKATTQVQSGIFANNMRHNMTTTCIVLTTMLVAMLALCNFADSHPGEPDDEEIKRLISNTAYSSAPYEPPPKPVRSLQRTHSFRETQPEQTQQPLPPIEAGADDNDDVYDDDEYVDGTGTNEADDDELADRGFKFGKGGASVHKAKDKLSASQRALLEAIKGKDKCRSVYKAKKHGYSVEEHTVRTHDNYVLTMHRIVHPSQAQVPSTGGQRGKPFVLVHGLVGSSASFLRLVPKHYVAPARVFDARHQAEQLLSHRANQYATEWESTADRLQATHEGDKSASIESLSIAAKLMGKSSRKHFADVVQLDYDGDATRFAREFRQAHKKFDLPREAAQTHVTNSLALTLSNFGYDVWLVNLRGNQYARTYNGRMSADQAEYWDFDIDTIVREDLPASLSHVRQVSGWPADKPIGLTAYSYSVAHVLALLTKFPQYQVSLQPLVLVAPTLMTGTKHNFGFKYFMQTITKTLISSNGPFPSVARGKGDRIERLVCSIPVARKLCRLFETLLHGHPPTLSNLVVETKQTRFVRRDVDCGQTSTRVLHQIIENLKQVAIHPKYMAAHETRRSNLRGIAALQRRSVMLVHAESDDVAPPAEVSKIRDSALKGLALVDYVIQTPRFTHTDFLFDKRNQYLVNAEIARFATLFDLMIERPEANEPAHMVGGGFASAVAQ